MTRRRSKETFELDQVWVIDEPDGAAVGIRWRQHSAIGQTSRDWIWWQRPSPSSQR